MHTHAFDGTRGPSAMYLHTSGLTNVLQTQLLYWSCVCADAFIYQPINADVTAHNAGRGQGPPTHLRLRKDAEPSLDLCACVRAYTDMDLYFAGGADPLKWPEKAEAQFVRRLMNWGDIDKDGVLNRVFLKSGFNVRVSLCDFAL